MDDTKRYCSRFAAGTESYSELTEWYEDGGDDQGTAYVLASDFDALRATVARLEALLREVDECVYNCCGCISHHGGELQERIDAALAVEGK